MKITDIVRIPELPKQVNVQLREVVLDLRDKPHVMIRMRLRGWFFSQRAEEAFVVLGKEVSQFVRISPDGFVADAYFNHRLRSASALSFGYGQTIAWDFKVPVKTSTIALLDRKRLPKGHIDYRLS